MNAELKQKWIAALRSGDFKQGLGRLRSQDGAFCCLGVLCEVAGVRRDDKRRSVYIFEDGESHLSLRGRLREAVNGMAMCDDEENTCILANMNDDGEGFDGIADWIEQHVQAETA